MVSKYDTRSNCKFASAYVVRTRGGFFFFALILALVEFWDRKLV